MKDLFYKLETRLRLAELRRKLGEVLGLDSEPGSDSRQIVLDSFDWRLYRRGLRLVGEPGPAGGLMRLINIDTGNTELQQLFDCEFPRFVTALPAGALRERIEPLLDMRAILSMADIRLRSYCMPLRDSEGKTRARLYVENARLLTPAGATRMIGKRLRLQPLKGYEKDARKIRKRLKTRFELQPSGDDLYERALAVAGQEPGGYSGKLSISLRPDLRADAAVRKVLQVLFDAMLANEQGTVDNTDSEFLHDFRVAVRRTRSLLETLEKVFPPATRQRFLREFAWLGNLTGRVRDLDVYLLKFGKYQAALPGSMRADLEPLRCFLTYKQAREHSENLVVELKSRRYRNLKKQWQGYLQSSLPVRPTARDAARSIGEVARRRTWKTYRRALREGAAINAESPHDDLHELRKTCKKLRYLLEGFQSLYAEKPVKAMIRELRLLQDNLGDFNDLDVQIGNLGAYVMEMRRRGECSAATGKAMDALVNSLEKQMQAERNRFDKRFARFARPSNRKAFRKLLHADTAQSPE